MYKSRSISNMNKCLGDHPKLGHKDMPASSLKDPPQSTPEGGTCQNIDSHSQWGATQAFSQPSYNEIKQIKHIKHKLSI